MSTRSELFSFTWTWSSSPLRLIREVLEARDGGQGQGRLLRLLGMNGRADWVELVETDGAELQPPAFRKNWPAYTMPCSSDVAICTWHFVSCGEILRRDLSTAPSGTTLPALQPEERVLLRRMILPSANINPISHLSVNSTEMGIFCSLVAPHRQQPPMGTSTFKRKTGMEMRLLVNECMNCDFFHLVAVPWWSR